MATATATKSPAKRAAKKVAPPATAPARNNTRGQIQIRLPHDLVERLGVEADRRRVSKTFLVEQMIATALPKWEEQSIGVD